ARVRRGAQLGFCVPSTAPLLLLAFLTQDVLARILHALALLGVGRSQIAGVGYKLPDLLLVGAGDHDLGRLRSRDRDAFRDRKDHVVTVAERELQVLALHAGAIADAGDLK